MSAEAWRCLNVEFWRSWDRETAHGCKGVLEMSTPVWETLARAARRFSSAQTSLYWVGAVATVGKPYEEVWFWVQWW